MGVDVRCAAGSGEITWKIEGPHPADGGRERERVRPEEGVS